MRLRTIVDFFTFAATLVAFTQTAGAQETFKLQSTGGTVLFKAPENVKELGKVPLFLWMHGSGDSPQNMFKFADQAPGNEKAVICSVGAQNRRGWTKGIDDKGVDEAIRIMKDKFPIDDKRIWMCGFSAGGFFAYGRAVRFPDDVEGIIIGGSGVTPQYPFPGEKYKARSYVIIGGRDMNKRHAVTLRDKVQELKAIEIHFEEDPAMAHSMKPDQIAAAYEWALKKNKGEKKP